MTDAQPLAGAAPTRLLWRQTPIVEIIKRTDRVTSFVFARAAPLAFQAGQHMDVRLTAPDGYQAERSYSIASAPEQPGRIELAIERLDDGEVSPFFHDVAAVGDEIELRGPIGGHFVWRAGDGGPVLLVGAGSGVAPLMSMIRHRAAAGSAAPMLLLLSARTWDEVIFRDELIGLEGGGFQFVMALTREPVRRDTDFGRRIDAQMVGQLISRLPAPPRSVYVCGSNAFVNVAADGAVAAGVQPGIVKTERYGV